MSAPDTHGKLPQWLERLLEQGNTLYHPVFLRLKNEGERVMHRQLLEFLPHVMVYDQIQSQLMGLLKTRHPERKYTKAQLDEEVASFLGSLPEDYGVWVYYPWSQRLVHLLDQAEFVELRTARNAYKITPTERDLLARKRIGIMGISVGQSVALTIAMERSFGEIRLADFDTLELSNMNRIRSGVHNLGVHKTILAAREIAEIDPFLPIICFSEGVDEANLDRFLLEGGQLDILVDECDSLDMKIAARYRARELRIPVVMDTSDRGMLDVERFDLEPERSLLHGLIGDIEPSQLRGLTLEEKVPFILSILGVETLSRRAKASMVELGETIETWPQLASGVVLGGAVTADVCRRIALGHYHQSGRYFVDLEELVDDKMQPAIEPEQTGVSPTITQSLHPLSFDEMQSLVAQLPPHETTECLLPDRQRLCELVEAATRAPSVGNSQPWQWIYHDGNLSLFHDRSRSLSLLDYEPNASLVALGAASENLVLQAHALGMEVSARRFPLGERNQLIATFSFLPSGSDGQVELHVCDELAGMITSRHTNRKDGLRTPLASGDLTKIRQAAESIDGAAFVSLEDEEALRELADCMGAADRIRLLHRRFHGEMLREIRWTYEEEERSRDGLGVGSMDLSVVEQANLQMLRDWRMLNLLHEWGVGRALEKMAKNAVNTASSVALIAMPGRSPADYFDGGRAMQRAWLTANSLHLSVRPFMSLVYLNAALAAGVDFPQDMADELRQSRNRYRRLFALDDRAGEVLLFCMSVTEPTSARSLRRRVDDILRFSSS